LLCGLEAVRDDEAPLGRDRHGTRPEREEIDVERVPRLRQEGRRLVHATAERPYVALAAREELREVPPWQLDVGKRQVGEAAGHGERGGRGQAGRDGNGAVHPNASTRKDMLPVEHVPERDRRRLVVVPPIPGGEGWDFAVERVAARRE